LSVARLPWAHCRRGTAYRARRIGRRSDDRSKVDRRAPHKPNACLGSLRTSLVPECDQTLLIFRPNGELFDRQLFRLGFIGRVYQTDKRCRRCRQAANFPGTLFLLFTHSTHGPNIAIPAVLASSPVTCLLRAARARSTNSIAASNQRWFWQPPCAPNL
jgi:hypothetical protein